MYLIRVRYKTLPPMKSIYIYIGEALQPCHLIYTQNLTTQRLKGSKGKTQNADIKAFSFSRSAMRCTFNPSMALSKALWPYVEGCKDFFSIEQSFPIKSSSPLHDKYCGLMALPPRIRSTISHAKLWYLGRILNLGEPIASA